MVAALPTSGDSPSPWNGYKPPASNRSGRYHDDDDDGIAAEDDAQDDDDDDDEAQVGVAMPRGGETASVQTGQATILSSVANLLNTIVGTGMLAMPHAVSYTGVLPGILLIFLCAACAYTGLLLLMKCAQTLGGRRNSFFSVGMATMPRGARIFDAAIALKCYGVSISYLIICGQLMPQVVLSFSKALHGHHEYLPHFLLDRNFWIFSFMLILTPLCFLRKLDSLRHTSYLSGLAVIYLVFIVISYSLPRNHSKLPPAGEVHLIKIDTHHFLSTFPVFVFAFTCAQNCLPVYNELSATPLSHMRRAKTATGGSIATAAFVYLIVGCLGYISFGDKVGDNIIAMYPSSSLFVCFGRLAIVILVLLSYPLQLHPCRAALDKVISFRSHSPDDDDAHEPLAAAAAAASYRDVDGSVTGEMEAANGQSPLTPASGSDRRPYANIHKRRAAKQEAKAEISLAKWCALTCLILTTTFIVALLVDDLSIILGFVGSMGSTTISFILPGLLYAFLHRGKESDNWRRPAIALSCFGAVVLVVSLTANTLKLLNHSGPQSKADRVAALIGGH